MRHKRRTIIAVGVVFVIAAVVLYFVLAPGRLEPLALSPTGPSKTGPQSQSAQTPLVHEFIRWYEFQFVSRMRRVGGFSTDVQDLVNEMGLDKTLDRYVALRQVNLNYVLQHPDCRTIPEEDLERLAREQFERIVSSARSSRRWIDYNSPKVKQAGIEPLKQMALAWIPFYQKLLSTPASPGGTLQERMRAHVSRDEYVQTIERVTRAKAAWHAAVKQGIVWYASWVSWATTMSDNVSRQDIAGCWATVDDIYGDPKEPNKVVTTIGQTAQTNTRTPRAANDARPPAQATPPKRP